MSTSNTVPNSIRPQDLVTQVNPHDVLFGRGSGPNDHEGNIAFRELVASRKPQYLATNRRQQKAEIAKQVVDAVMQRGGRFLKKLEGAELEELSTILPPGVDAYVVADETTIMEKAKQALRQNRDRAVRDLSPVPPSSMSGTATAAASLPTTLLGVHNNHAAEHHPVASISSTSGTGFAVPTANTTASSMPPSFMSPQQMELYQQQARLLTKLHQTEQLLEQQRQQLQQEQQQMAAVQQQQQQAQHPFVPSNNNNNPEEFLTYTMALPEESPQQQQQQQAAALRNARRDSMQRSGLIAGRRSSVESTTRRSSMAGKRDSFAGRRDSIQIADVFAQQNNSSNPSSAMMMSGSGGGGASSSIMTKNNSAAYYASSMHMSELMESFKGMSTSDMQTSQDTIGTIDPVVLGSNQMSGLSTMSAMSVMSIDSNNSLFKMSSDSTQTSEEDKKPKSSNPAAAATGDVATTNKKGTTPLPPDTSPSSFRMDLGASFGGGNINHEGFSPPSPQRHALPARPSGVMATASATTSEQQPQQQYTARGQRASITPQDLWNISTKSPGSSDQSSSLMLGQSSVSLLAKSGLFDMSSTTTNHLPFMSEQDAAAGVLPTTQEDDDSSEDNDDDDDI